MNWLERKILRAKVQSFVDNAIKESQMSQQTKGYLIGLANATISGVTAGAASLTVGVGLKKSAIILAAAAAMSLAKWVAQHPIPGAAQ